MNSTRLNAPRFLAASSAALAAALLLPALAAADRIVYTCDAASGTDDICLVDPDAGSPTNLTETDLAAETGPAWSPDGTSLSYVTSPPGQIRDVFTLAIADPDTVTNISQTPNRFEFSGSFQLAEWSPAGGRVAYQSDPVSSADPLGSEAFVSPADGTAAPIAVGSSAADEWAPTWSPDGTKLAFSRGTSAIYTANADGSGTATVVPGSGGGYQSDWSADGSRIAFQTTGGSINVVRADGTGTPVTLGSAPGFVISGPFFSPDSTRVMWGTTNAIFIRSADGTGPTTQITMPNGIYGGLKSWSPDSTRIAFGSADGVDGVDLFVANSDGTGTPRAVATGDGINADPVWEPTGESPAVPPVDPPFVPTRPRVTSSLASFRRRSVAPENGFIPISFVICSYPSPSSTNPNCRWDPSGQIRTPLQSPGRAQAAGKAKVKTLRLPGVSTELAYGAEGELRLRLTKAARKALRPGRTYNLEVTIAQAVGSDPVVTTTETLKLRMPKAKKRKK